MESYRKPREDFEQERVIPALCFRKMRIALERLGRRESSPIFPTPHEGAGRPGRKLLSGAEDK